MDPFIDLYVDISQYSTVGKVILLSDLNACTRALYIPLHDLLEDMLSIREIDAKSMGLHQISDNALGPFTTYGHHLL